MNYKTSDKLEKKLILWYNIPYINSIIQTLYKQILNEEVKYYEEQNDEDNEDN